MADTDGRRAGRWRRAFAGGAAAVVAASLLTPSLASAQVAGFGDVPADSPHAPAIVDLQARGVVQGKDDGSFGPRDLLTRAQLASMLARAEGLAPVSSGPFPDVSGPHAGAINALASRDIIQGRSDGRFDPQGTITRDQVASMLARYLELDAVASGPFRDVPAANVHAGAINALAAIGVAQGNARDDYQPRDGLRRDQAASFVARALAHTSVPACDFDAPVPATATGDEVAGFTPTITVSDTDALVEGETITVTGSGFDPASNVGTRPPLAGEPAGIYVVFGNFSDDWRPSAGAGTASRAIGTQAWAIPGATPDFMVDDPEYVQLESDGSFVAELEIELPTTSPGGRDGFGIHTYAGGGAINANHELAVPVTLAGVMSPGVDDIEIEWGIKRSFRDYLVGGIAQGSITTSGAVSQTSDGTFTWAATWTDHPHPDGDVARSTDGEVVLTGHRGSLRVALSDLQVVHEEAPGTALLYADVCSRSLDDGQDVAYPDLHIADLTAIDGDGDADGFWTEYAATLTEAGVPAFAGQYEAGETLDPLTIRGRYTR